MILAFTVALFVTQCPIPVPPVTAGHDEVADLFNARRRRSVVRRYWNPCFSGPRTPHPIELRGPLPVSAVILSCKAFDNDCDGDVDLKDYALELRR